MRDPSSGDFLVLIDGFDKGDLFKDDKTGGCRHYIIRCGTEYRI